MTMKRQMLPPLFDEWAYLVAALRQIAREPLASVARQLARDALTARDIAWKIPQRVTTKRKP